MRTRNRGSVMVELSLVGIIFFALVVGILDFGQSLFIQQAIVERARYAARWGAISDPTNSTAITNMVLYLQAPTPTNVSPSFGLAASNVSVSTADAGTDNYRLVVQISGYQFAMLSPFLAGAYTGAPIVVSVPLGQYN
jgi:Flp pilus assembly protein TadG